MMNDNKTDTERSEQYELPGIHKEPEILPTAPIIGERFDTYNEAVSFQRKWMKRLLEEGWTFREVYLGGEHDFDCQTHSWQVYIRCFPKAA